MNLIHFYLLSPLHTGGMTQEGNLVGIARESHTTLPYIPSSTIRGKIRSLATEETLKFKLFGNEIDRDAENLLQGDIWIGDGSILWLPISSLSHGVVWITSPLLLRRWTRLTNPRLTIPPEYSCSFKRTNRNVYLKDAILKDNDLKDWSNWPSFIPQNPVSSGINQVLVLPDQHCTTLIQMSLWRQVKIKLDEHKSVDGGLRYEEAIPPDTLMYFPWGVTSQANQTKQQSQADFKRLLANNDIIQIGGQESLGRGFVQQL
ncbi:MAG: type III-B CRISPR module RAMP protein Cmr4 [Microcystis aeruginosa L211-07]|nr:type III-B CRISPR module RAMP protein Cmr4 [Microcystis aeruginosa L211-07]